MRHPLNKCCFGVVFEKALIRNFVIWETWQCKDSKRIWPSKVNVPILPKKVWIFFFHPHKNLSTIEYHPNNYWWFQSFGLFFHFIYWGCHHPNLTNSIIFQDGFPNHQPGHYYSNHCENHGNPHGNPYGNPSDTVYELRI